METFKFAAQVVKTMNEKNENRILVRSRRKTINAGKYKIF